MLDKIEKATHSPNSSEKMMEARYQQAHRLEAEPLEKNMVINTAVWPKWIGDTDTFIYERETRVARDPSVDDGSEPSFTLGKTYRLVDPVTATNISAFNHDVLARALSKAMGQPVDPLNLPISQVGTHALPSSITFYAFDRNWVFHKKKGQCEERPLYPEDWLMSPDGKKAAFLRDYNLWLRDLESGDEYPLTNDGERYNAYGAFPERADIMSEFSGSLYPNVPQALWSPDSSRLFTQKTDERQMRSLPVINYVPEGGDIRPKLSQPKYALPDDKQLASFQLLTLQVERKEAVQISYPAVLDVGIAPSLFHRRRVWWGKDSRTAYFVDMTRGEKRASVLACDTKNGATKILFEESADSYIDLNVLNEDVCAFLPLPDSEELIWWSERSGWAHLYLYDLKTGALKRKLTDGDWLVKEIIGVDLERRDVYFQALGRHTDRDPYYGEVCRASLETGELTVLASSDHNFLTHKSGTFFTETMSMFGRDVSEATSLSPTGNYFVASHSRVNGSPVSELRDRKGNVVMHLESADASGLPEDWQWPEPVKLLAADGNTDTYGVVFRPTYFDPDKQYPVIDFVQSHATVSNVPKSAFFSDLSSAVYFSAAAWAELGFIVVIIDGRGSSLRSKAFRDESYGRTQTASNLEDHIAGIKQLAERYSYIDIERVGITSPGGCNGPVYGLLAYPDFYKVGTAHSIYDPRLTHGTDIYQGASQENDYGEGVLGNLAGNLKGKLLLVAGMRDNFYHTAGMLQLVDALVRENKKFDMLMLPNEGHMWQQAYSLNRAWDYMVEYLQGSQPPGGSAR